MKRFAPLITTCLMLAATAAPASADFILYGSHSDYAPVPGADLADVRLAVNLSVAGGQAIMTFTNVSAAPELTAVFKEIVVDTYDDDTGTAILWGGTVLTDTKDVSYTIGESNGLPGFGPQTRDAFPLAELQAGSPPPKMGIGPGEVLQVRFQTLLPDGAGIYDYFAAFGGGQDTADYAIGFHAISATVVNGESLAGSMTHMPEPATALLVCVGALAGVLRPRRGH